MTATSHEKLLKQIGGKPGKMAKYKKYNVPKERTGGVLGRKCTRCGSTHGLVRKYGINLCRQCFREIAPSLGFKKFN
jgi:small subunit ribosomal protein S14